MSAVKTEAELLEEQNREATNRRVHNDRVAREFRLLVGEKNKVASKSKKFFEKYEIKLKLIPILADELIVSSNEEGDSDE